MDERRTFAAKYVYPSELGLHIEHYTEAEARAAYEDAKSRGINNVRLDGLILTWMVFNPRKSEVPELEQLNKTENTEND